MEILLEDLASVYTAKLLQKFFFFFLMGSNSSGCVGLDSAVVNRANKQENKSAMTSVRGGAGEKKALVSESATCNRVKMKCEQKQQAPPNV